EHRDAVRSHGAQWSTWTTHRSTGIALSINGSRETRDAARSIVSARSTHQRKPRTLWISPPSAMKSGTATRAGTIPTIQSTDSEPSAPAGTLAASPAPRPAATVGPVDRRLRSLGCVVAGDCQLDLRAAVGRGPVYRGRPRADSAIGAYGTHRAGAQCMGPRLRGGRLADHHGRRCHARRMGPVNEAQ